MNKENRAYYIDWIKIGVVLLLVPFHTAVTFNPVGIIAVQYPQNNPILMNFTWFMDLWAMPLLFLVAGMNIYHSLRNRTVKEYILERFKKLLIPFCAGYLLICPIISYFKVLFIGSFSGDFFHFYPHFFGKPGPHSNNSPWHLYFLIVLFLYSLILLPFFAWIYKNNIRDKLISGTSFLEKNLLVYLLVIPLMTTQLIFLYFLPINTIYEASKFISYLLFLFYGFVFITNDKILDNIHRIRLFSLIIGVTLFLAIIIWLMNGGEGRSNSLFYLYNTLMVFSWVFAILGYSKKFLNRKIPFYKYLNNSSYPFYIFHFLPLTIFAYYFAKGGLNLWMKYLLIVFGTYISTFLIYEFVKRIPYFNFLFGIKRI